jgi:hypothetical protein
MCHPLNDSNNNISGYTQACEETATYVTNLTADKRRDYCMQEEIKKTKYISIDVELYTYRATIKMLQTGFYEKSWHRLTSL